MSSMRINRYLAVCGVGSRRRVEPMIKNGNVFVNGAPMLDLSYQVKEGDQIEVFGALISPPAQYRVIAFNKPRNTLCTRDDPEGRHTIYDVLPPEFKNFQYVGRLDFATHGLLLLTDDGELAQRLTLPKWNIPRTYSVRLDRKMEAADIKKIAEGVYLPADSPTNTGVHALPAAGEAYGNKLSLVLTEGKNREIRRMMTVLGYEVEDLKRTQYGSVHLGSLDVGSYRELSDDEIWDLANSVELA
jgi:23S rRNA pseudouridine2605 synthase